MYLLFCPMKYHNMITLKFRIYQTTYLCGGVYYALGCLDINTNNIYTEANSM